MCTISVWMLSCHISGTVFQLKWGVEEKHVQVHCIIWIHSRDAVMILTPEYTCTHWASDAWLQGQHSEPFKAAASYMHLASRWSCASFFRLYFGHACPCLPLTSAQAFRQVFLNPSSANTSFLEGSASKVLLMMCLRTTASPALQSLPVSSSTAGRRQPLTSWGRSSNWMSDTSRDSGSWFFSDCELAGLVKTRKTLKDLHSQ